MATQGLKIEFPPVMDLRIASLYLNMSEGRMRALVREEKIKGTKTEQGWEFLKADLDVFNATPRPRAGGGTRTTKDGKAFVVHVVPAKLQGFKDAMAKLEITVENRYDYTKQRAYQLKRKAAKAAAAAKAQPAPVTAVAQPAK
jgi:hypothetical protein